MTMFRRLRERHITLGQKILHPIEHYIMPAVATAIFIFVLYESIVPPIFPVTQAVLISSVYLVLAVLYVVVLSKKRPETVKRAGRLVNMVEEESGGID